MTKKIYIFLLIIGVSFCFVSQAFARKSYAGARQKVCYTNQRMIESAIEEYEKTGKSIADMVPDSDINKVLKLLVENKYLEKVPDNPEKKCQLKVNLETKNCPVFCVYHGSRDLSVPPSEEFNKSTIDVNVNRTFDMFALVIGFVICAILFMKDIRKLVVKEEEKQKQEEKV